MNPILSQLIVYVVGGVAVAFVAFRMGRADRTKRDLAARQSEARATRQILHLENQHNLGGLKEYMRRVEQVPPLQGTYGAMEIEWRRRVVEHDLPVWSHDFRNQPAPLLPMALSETDRPKFFDLHAGLDRLTVLRAKLQQDFTDDIRAVAIRCRENPALEQVGSIPGRPTDPAYQEARAFAVQVQDFNDQTQVTRAEWQGIYNTLMPMMDLLVGDIPPDQATSRSLAHRLRQVRERLTRRLPRVQVTWPSA